ncbi:MAG TPA: (E)-4-hydroxy-3-methylbut-2-enyl-diphosphate synthase [Planctomycetaceae bacterium]|nr:(E)-4-hydroxy-3-methylbut-2-enyl-diphosphate synthase [Planctomycetaceae bacterium]
MAETETMVAELPPRKTRAVRIGTIEIGAGRPIAVQSMTATKTTDIDATTRQINDLVESGADIVRVAVDSRKDAEALAEISRQTKANLSVDLQENYRLAELVAPFVAKLRYNPGHLYHHERSKPWQEKVRYIAGVAAENDCAVRVGVNCGSVDPDKKEGFDPADSISPMLSSALDHCEFLDRIGFTRYCVSLKDSDPAKVIDVNRRFAESRPDVPLHLGVTEAGMPPDGIIKTRIAFEQLISRGIGDTIRVSLTVPNNRKGEEIVAGRKILEDIAAGRVRTVVDFGRKSLNIISCPSCSRVENEAFVDLAAQVKELTTYAKEYALTIAVMGCRVNGPGETDDADLGLWCAPNFVNLKRGGIELGAFPYDEILPRLKQELDALIAAKSLVASPE